LGSLRCATACGGGFALAVAVAGGGIYLLTAPDGGGGGLNHGDLLTLITGVVFRRADRRGGRAGAAHDARRLVWLQLAGTAVAAGVAAFALEAGAPGVVPALAGTLLFTGAGATAASARVADGTPRAICRRRAQP